MSVCRNRDLGLDVVGDRIIGRVSVRSHVMYYRFGHSIEEQSNADAAGVVHDEPGDVIELWLVIVFAQLDTRILGKVEPNEEQNPDVLRRDVQPSEDVRQPFLKCFFKCIHNRKKDIQID